MSEMGEIWEGMKAMKQAKRADNRAASAQMLTQAGISFEQKNGGAHLVVTALGRTIDFWPGTGLWIVRGQQRQQRGVRGLIKACTPSTN